MATRSELEHRIAVLTVDWKKAADRLLDMQAAQTAVWSAAAPNARKMSAAFELNEARAAASRAEMSLYTAAGCLEDLDG